jgi:hypothetical protein
LESANFLTKKKIREKDDYSAMIDYYNQFAKKERKKPRE